MKTAFSRRSVACMALALGILTVAGGQTWKTLAQARAASTAVQPAQNVRYSEVKESDLKEWLTYLASDELQGRQILRSGDLRQGAQADLVEAPCKMRWNTVDERDL